MKLCSSSSPVCLGRGGGGQISLKHICSWMLMRGNTALGELIPMFSPPFAPPVLLARGTPWSWHGCSVPCSLQSWIFQEYTDEISIESSVPAYQRSQLACASHWSLSVCLCRSHVPKKTPSKGISRSSRDGC